MKKRTYDFCRNLRLTVAILLTAPGLSAALDQAQQPDGAADPGKPAASPLPATTPPEIIKPVPLTELINADAVFDELDPGRRGYVTRQDTKDLIGFGDAFQAIDTKGSGKLTRAQFRQAWARYKEGVKQ